MGFALKKEGPDKAGKKEKKEKTKQPKNKKAPKKNYKAVKKPKIEISSKDKKLLILAGAFALFLGTYFFGFSKTLTKVQEIEAGNDALNTRITELQARASQAVGLEADTKAKTEEMTEMLSEFPSDVRTENVIYFLDGLEKFGNDKFKILNEGFGAKEMFYQTGSGIMPDGTAQTAEAAEVPADGAEAATPPEETVPAEPAEPADVYTGYRITADISYETDYDGLKQILDKINQNEDKVRIQTLSANYDNSTGRLSGNMQLSFYAVSGNGKEYVAPDVKSIPLGTENIFGTVKAADKTGQ